MEVDTNKQYTGKVKTFSNGWGFIDIDDSEIDKDIFVHWTGLTMSGYKQLVPGERVSCYLERDIAKNKWHAVAVEVI